MTASNGVANGSAVPAPANPKANARDVSALRQAYDAAGQGHVFAFWDQLSPAEQTSFATQLAGIDVERVNRIYNNAIAAAGIAEGGNGDGLGVPSFIGKDKSRSPSPAPEEATALPEAAVASTAVAEDEARWRDIGLKAIADGQVAVLLMAGGQGTRLGSPDPKGMYDIQLPSNKTLFEYQAGRIKRLAAVAAAATGKNPADVRIRWYVMTSGPTRPTTEKYFEDQQFFGLPKEDIVFFEQGVLPALSNDGKLLLATPSSVSVAPDGNGGLYSALRKPFAAGAPTTVLSDLRDRGIKFIHAYCVDNCLVKVADPVFIGCCIEREAVCGAKVVRKTEPTESVGVIAKRGNAYAVIEYSELPKEKSEMRDANGDLTFWAANIANHFYTTDFLETVEAMERKMAFHIARKKIACVDPGSGQQIKPTEPNGMKLEMFVFDVFPFVSNLTVLEVARAEEFSPLKNAPGSKADCPETSRRDLLAQQRRWLEAAGAQIAQGAEVEVTPDVTYAGEGLDFVKGAKFGRTGVIARPEDAAALA